MGRNDLRTPMEPDVNGRMRALILTAANADGDAAFEAEEEILHLGERAIPFLLEARIEIATHIKASELLFRIAETDPLMLVRSDALAEAIVDNNDERAWLVGKKLLPRCSVATRLVLTSRKQGDSKKKSSLKWLAENEPDGFIEGALSAIREPRSGSEVWAPVLEVAGEVGQRHPKKFLSLIKEIVETKEHVGINAETAISKIGLSRAFTFFAGMDVVDGETELWEAMSVLLKEGKLEKLEKALSNKVISRFAEKFIIGTGLSDEALAKAAAKLLRTRLPSRYRKDTALKEITLRVIGAYRGHAKEKPMQQTEAAECTAIMLEALGREAAQYLVFEIGLASGTNLGRLAELSAALCKRKPRLFSQKDVNAVAKKFIKEDPDSSFIKHLSAFGPRALPWLVERCHDLNSKSPSLENICYNIHHIVAADPDAPEVAALKLRIVKGMIHDYGKWRKMEREIAGVIGCDIIPTMLEFVAHKTLQTSHLLRLSEFIQRQPAGSKDARDVLWLLLGKLEKSAKLHGPQLDARANFAIALGKVVRNDPAEAEAVTRSLHSLLKKKDDGIWSLAAMALPHAGTNAKAELLVMPIPNGMAAKKRHLAALTYAWEKDGITPDSAYLSEYMNLALSRYEDIGAVGIRTVGRVGHSAIGDVTEQFWKLGAKKHLNSVDVSKMNRCITILGEIAATHKGDSRNMKMIPFLMRTLGMPGHQNDAEVAIIAVGRQAVLPLLDEATRNPEFAALAEKIIAMIDSKMDNMDTGVVATPARPEDMKRIFSNMALDVPKPAGNLVRVK